jgi:hypothetical protein
MATGTTAALAALTYGATTVTTDGVYTLDGVAASVYTVGGSTTTGTITIGGTAQTGAIAIGDTASSTVSEISIGGGDGIKTAINIGDGTGANGINIGGTGANTIAIGNTQTGGSVSIGAAMTGGTITIGGTGLQVGTIGIGTGTGAQGINLGTGGTGAKTIAIGGTAANVITLGNTQTGGSVSIGAAMTTGTVTIGSMVYTPATHPARDVYQFGGTGNSAKLAVFADSGNGEYNAFSIQGASAATSASAGATIGNFGAVWYNADYNNAYSLGTKRNRFNIGANYDADLLLSSPHQVRIVASDNTVTGGDANTATTNGVGNIVMISRSDVKISPWALAESVGNNYLIVSGVTHTVANPALTPGVDQYAAGNITLETNAGDLVLQPTQGNVTVGGHVLKSIGAAVAAAGTDQTNGVALTKDINNVTGADGTKGAVLPTAVAGLDITVINQAGSTLKLYGFADAQQINGVGGATAYSVATITSVRCIAISTTNWECEKSAR